MAERYPRFSFQIADKLPGWKVKRRKDCERYFQKQCERCGVGFFDVYLLHWLNQINYAIAERFDEFGFLNRLKVEGQIGKPDFPIMGTQPHYKCYDIAARFGKEIVVMEPVKGGTLADPPQEAVRLLRQAAPKESMVFRAIRFAQSLEQVSIVLSGMNTMEQMQDNMRDMVPLSRPEYALLEQASAIIAKSTTIPCTGCRYCVKECPKGIAIPDYFRIYNGYSRFPAEGWKMEPVYASIAQTNGRASDCIHCHACERNCPQQIPITQWLAKVAKALE